MHPIDHCNLHFRTHDSLNITERAERNHTRVNNFNHLPTIKSFRKPDIKPVQNIVEKTFGKSRKY